MYGHFLLTFRHPPSQQGRACVCQGHRKEKVLQTNRPGSPLTKAQTDRPTKTHTQIKKKQKKHT